MKTRAILALVAVAGTAVAANAQNTATYSIVFNSAGAVSGNGTNNIQVNPGSVVTATVFVTINPGIGAMVGNPPGAVQGLSDGGFSISGGTGAGSWAAGPSLVAPYNFPLGTNAGTPAGGNVNGVLWGLGFLLQLPHPSPNSPDDVWTGTFNAGAALGVSNFTFTGLATTGVFYGGPIPAVLGYTSNAGAGGSISVVPAPASLALLGLGGLVAARRRR